MMTRRHRSRGVVMFFFCRTLQPKRGRQTVQTDVATRSQGRRNRVRIIYTGRSRRRCSFRHVSIPFIPRWLGTGEENLIIAKARGRVLIAIRDARRNRISSRLMHNVCTHIHAMYTRVSKGPSPNAIIAGPKPIENGDESSKRIRSPPPPQHSDFVILLLLLSSSIMSAPSPCFGYRERVRALVFVVWTKTVRVSGKEIASE